MLGFWCFASPLEIKLLLTPLWWTMPFFYACFGLSMVDANIGDELQFTFGKMHGFSTVDGFMEVRENLAEMIKYVANEPSLGLFYIQQHTQNALPNIVTLKNNVAKKSRETSLHTGDLEDSIAMTRSMKDCGIPIIDDMIGDIRNSLALMSSKQPKRGLIRNPMSGVQMRRTISWGGMSWESSVVSDNQDYERSENYFSSVLKSAKQKATNIRWSKQESQRVSAPETLFWGSSSGVELLDELPVSSMVRDDGNEEDDDEEVGRESQNDVKLRSGRFGRLSEDYDCFQANREAKLEEWLGERDDQDDRNGGRHRR